MLRPEEERCLVDQNSDQPTFEGAFGAESWRVAGGCQSAVFYRLVGFFNAVQNAAGDEMEQFAGTREPQVKGILFDLPVYFVFFAFFVLAGLGVGLAVAAGKWNVEMPGASLGSVKELGGGRCHKHVSVLQLV